MLVNLDAITKLYDQARLVHAVADGRCRWADPLPDLGGQGWCPGASERCVELPLSMEVARWQDSGLVLDAGSSLQMDSLAQAFGPPQCRLVHVCQCPHDAPKFNGASRSYLFTDLRALEVKSGVFDRAVCISTLEHVGMDNSRYGGEAEHNRESWSVALDEILRVLKLGALLFVSVPFGLAEDCQWFQVFDRSMIDRLMKVVRNRNGLIEERVFSRETTEHGWRDGADVGRPAIWHSPNTNKTRVLQLWCGRITAGAVEDNQ